MNLGFKTEFPDGTPTNFVQKILDGEKIHTIRLDNNDRWGNGLTIHFATGIRTKKYKCFKVCECVSTQKIEFIWRLNNKGFGNESWQVMVFIDEINVTSKTGLIDQLAKNDGFNDRKQFFEWEGWYKKDFEGKILHWTNKKY